MKVCVIGCGPAGLLAAHAVEQAGHELTILSKKQPSSIHGAQYLHEHIEGVTREDKMEVVTFTKVGNREGYAQKVYGRPDAPTSWDVFELGQQPAWSMELAYLNLWNRFRATVQDNTISADDIDFLCADFDLVLCSAPADRLCLNSEHRFDVAKVWTGRYPMLRVRNLVVYNGRREDAWYRASNLFGYHAIEFGNSDNWPPVPDLAESNIDRAIKPISNTCDCHLRHESFKRIGRFGKWEKGQLVSNAYHDATLAIKDREADLAVH